MCCKQNGLEARGLNGSPPGVSQCQSDLLETSSWDPDSGVRAGAFVSWRLSNALHNTYAVTGVWRVRRGPWWFKGDFLRSALNSCPAAEWCSINFPD